MEIKNNKVLNIILKVITGLLIAFTVFIMIFTVVSVTTLDKNDRNLFGFRFYIVQTDSMSPSENNAHLDVHFSAGDIVVIKNVKNPTKLEAGDIIAFISTNKVSYGETVTHMIRKPTVDKDGRTCYVTYGTNTNTDDEACVYPEYVIGEYAGKLPGVGHFFAFVKSTPGYICCILIPFLLLILYNGADVIRLFRKYKKEQTAILDAEKAEIAAERARNEEMLRELLALKNQLAGNAPAEAQPTATAEAPVTETATVVEATPTVEEKPMTEEEIAAQKKAEAARKRKETLARKKAEAEATKLAEEEAARKAAEEEEKRLADEAAAQKKAEAARKRKETLARKKAEAEAEAARVAAEEEAQRLADEAAAQKKAEAARKRKETLARKKAEAEAAKAAESNPDDKSDT